MHVSASDLYRSAKPGKNGQLGYQLSLVIPAWNEEATIRQAIQEAESALSRTADEYEIVIVDDGSHDDTAEIVAVEAELNPHVRLVQHPKNLGYGAALRTGFQAARYDLVAFTDADCQFHLDELEYMLPLTRRYAVTCGYRIDRQDPALRRFFSWGYNTLVGLLLGSPVHDMDCALKIFQRPSLAGILPECNNFFVNTEMLTKARQQGLSVVEVGVHHRPRVGGESKVSLRDIPRTLTTLLPFWWSRVLFPGRSAASVSVNGWFWAALILLAVVAGGLLFPGLSYPLMEPDEGRYAEISREMLRTGDWIVPQLNRQPYLDKPPLLYWLVAGSYSLFGVSEQAARLVPALAAFCTVLGMYLFGRRIVGARAAFLGALVLTLIPGFIQSGRILLLDSVLTLFVSLSLLMAYFAVQGRSLLWGWWLASAFCCALGVMTKGPVALVLLAPPVIVHTWLNRLETRPTWRHWLAHILVILGCVTPWYVAVTVRDPGFGYEFVVNHHLKRFFVGTYHEEPIWYYLLVLFVTCFPWSLLAVWFARFLFSRAPAIQNVRSPAMGFILLWAGWCVLFFSLSRGKLPSYILPAGPAIALLVGCFLEHVLLRRSAEPFFERARRSIPRRALLGLGVAWLALSSGAWWLGFLALGPYLLQALLCCGGVIGLGVWGRRLSPRVLWGCCWIATAAVILEWGHGLIPAACYRHSPMATSEGITGLFRDPNTAIACYGQEWGSIPFDLRRDDVQNFTHRSVGELTEFIRLNRRTLLIVPALDDVESIRWVIPGGMELRKVGEVARATVLLIQSPPTPAAAGSRSHSQNKP